ncbi:MAG: hypothetical protein Q4E69_04505 [Bacilli bacterium]|nr:hypothetical protein [Bacilli bacterium]
MNRKYRKRKLPKFFFIISLALFLFIGIGYSIINSNLSMQGNVVRKATTWNIGFSNPVFDTGSITSPTPTITNGTTMTMNVSLASPGDIYAFTVDLKNTGSVPALINTLSITELTSEQQNYLRWKVEYEDESTPAVGDLLKAGETKKVHIYLEYKKLRATDLYPTSNVNLTLTITANFVLPEETFNTVTITKNGSTKLIQVSNLEQEVTLTDFPIETTDIVVACNNGVEPSTDTNDKIVLSKIKQDATCRIEPSLASAITNSSTEVTNMSLINNSTYNASINFNNNQDINLNFNGKEYSSVTVSNAAGFVLNSGSKLTIEDKKGTGRLLANLKGINVNSGSSLNIKSGTFERKQDGNTNGGILSTYGGTLNISGGYFKTDETYAIFLSGCSNQTVNISNAYIEATQYATFAIISNSENNVVNIRNSTIKNTHNNGAPVHYQVTQNNSIYLCNNTLIGNYRDIGFTNALVLGKIFYANNNVFIDGTSTPSITNNINNQNVIQSDIACAE